jgi:galactokinase
LIGEHTDYNQGFVLPMAIEQAVWIAFRRRKDCQVIIHSLNFDETASFSLESLQKEGNSWIEYVKGVAWAMQEQKMVLKGWEGVMLGDIPIGSGLSSSAAVEIAALRTFAEASRLEWNEVYAAELAQRAENEWMGVRCGIMDQMVSTAARYGHALLLDCRTLKYDHIRILPSITFVAMDTGTRRDLVNTAYNDRRLECQAAAQHFGVAALRDVKPEMLAEKDHGLDEILLRRARHVVTENVRVLDMVPALLYGDAKKAGRLLDESHASLRDDFEVTNPALNQIVEISRQHPACLGARMTGAGFGGCAVALVKTKQVENFSAYVVERYRQTSGLEARVYAGMPSQGASLIQKGIFSYRYKENKKKK